ncbi:MAG: FimB/Mfa2 family fimbrial subunit [Bacteroides sp.]|uniref:FimB/Mfa2 family fimbrial subunit n=1 Tax=Bacteroides sp. TaxID=29523 RepID=UPI002FC8D352
MKAVYQYTYGCISGILLFLTIVSCNINEDNSDCPSSIYIHFEYKNQGENLLYDKIKKILLYIFDSNGAFIEVREVSAQEYFNNTMKLSLLSNKKYTLVAVGNIFSHSAIYPTSDLSRLNLNDFYITALSESEKKSGIDPIYLGRIEVTTPDFPTSEDFILPFKKSHIKLNILIKSMQADLPKGMSIELQGVLSKKGLDGEPFGKPETYYMKGNTDINPYLFSSNIIDRRFDQITIILKNDIGETIFKTTLEDYLKEHGINPNENNEAPLEIVIAFLKNIWIGVTIEQWNEINVIPEY